MPSETRYARSSPCVWRRRLCQLQVLQHQIILRVYWMKGDALVHIQVIPTNKTQLKYIHSMRHVVTTCQPAVKSATSKSEPGCGRRLPLALSDTHLPTHIGSRGVDTKSLAIVSRVAQRVAHSKQKRPRIRTHIPEMIFSR